MKKQEQIKRKNLNITFLIKNIRLENMFKHSPETDKRLSIQRVYRGG